MFTVHRLLFLLTRLVPSSGVAAMVTSGSSPSSSVIRRISFQSHHFHVPVHSIYPYCRRYSSFSFSGWFHSSGWFHVYYLLAGTSQQSSSNMPKPLQSSFCHFDSYIPTAPRMYSFVILYFHTSTSTSSFHLRLISSPLLCCSSQPTSF